jgi:hypothetical protein
MRLTRTARLQNGEMGIVAPYSSQYRALGFGSHGSFCDRDGSGTLEETRRPQLVGQFEFVEWTDVNHLRHTKFITLLGDKKAKDARREM